ncbi:MAG: helix-turn-helix domain-containing protein [Gammaproteobacteria bacterium]|nr:helix-turn-helix domain-containing protein [Gammaproteobacteria bacterium]
MTAEPNVKIENMSNHTRTRYTNVTRLTPQAVNCQVCDPAGGCLAKQLLSNHEQPDRSLKTNRSIKAGEHIFREGDEFEFLSVVRSGSVKSYMVSDDGEEQVLGFYLPGDVFGLDGSNDNGRMSSAVTLETSTLCRLPVASIDDYDVTDQLLRLTSIQLQRDHNLVLMLARKDADGRLASFLCDLSHRYQARGYSSLAINLSMSRQDIGNYLGLAVETVSRTLTRFQESGLIHVRRRALEFIDLESLQRIAGVQV